LASLDKKIICFFGFVTLFNVLACTSLQQRLSLKNCKFALTQVDIRGFTFSDMTLGLLITVTNPNALDVKIDKMNLDLYIEDQKTVKVTFDPVTIQSHKTKTVTAALVIPYYMIGMPVIQGIKNKAEINYKLAGTVTLDTFLGAISFPVTILKN